MPLQHFIDRKRDEIIEACRDEFYFNEYQVHYSDKEILEGVLERLDEALSLMDSGETERLQEAFRLFACRNLELRIPFIVSDNQLNYLKNTIIHLMLEERAKQEIIDICLMFDSASNIVAKCYLEWYVVDLVRRNKIKLASLETLIDHSIIEHFEQHLRWLNRLVDAIMSVEHLQIPETDPALCQFGKWLHTQGGEFIKDEELLEEIHRVHNELHQIAQVVEKILGKPVADFHKLLTFLLKAELLSLHLGSSLALIKNAVVISQSTLDPLTQTLNRRLLDTIFFSQYDISKATDRCMTLAMADIDNFKQINDRYGHLAGDKVLQLFAQVVQEQLRESDFLFRYGGEEFLLLLPATGRTNAGDVINRIIKRLHEQPCIFEEYEIPFTVSFGLLEVKPSLSDETNAATLKRCLREVDEHLYLAKRRGKDQLA